jgi:hypothetical protein
MQQRQEAVLGNKASSRRLKPSLIGGSTGPKSEHAIGVVAFHPAMTIMANQPSFVVRPFLHSRKHQA